MQRRKAILSNIERFIRRDPAARGLISSEPQYGPLCSGHLAGAAEDLAQEGRCAVIVTGFAVRCDAASPIRLLHAEHNDRGSRASRKRVFKQELGNQKEAVCETDGPPGAVLLAATLQSLGIDSFVLTDTCCYPVVQAAAASCGFRDDGVLTVDAPSVCELQQIVFELTEGQCARPSHVIAVERAGPSHTEDSIRRQSPDNAAVVDAFLDAVPTEHCDRCHDMRGDIIDAWTAPLHRLFEPSSDAVWGPCGSPDVATIGISDGGNEIGMGSLPWEDVRRRLSGEQAGCIPCRIATDWTLIAGTSNWGAYALAAAVAVLKGDINVIEPFDCRQQETVLRHIVEHAGAVDGITRRREATVDGLPFVTYIQPWAGIRRLLELPE